MFNFNDMYHNFKNDLFYKKVLYKIYKYYLYFILIYSIYNFIWDNYIFIGSSWTLLKIYYLSKIAKYSIENMYDIIENNLPTLSSIILNELLSHILIDSLGYFTNFYYIIDNII